MGLGDCTVDSSVVFMGLCVVNMAWCSVQCSAQCSFNVLYSILKCIVCGVVWMYTLSCTVYNIECSVM